MTYRIHPDNLLEVISHPDELVHVRYVIWMTKGPALQLSGWDTRFQIFQLAVVLQCFCTSVPLVMLSRGGSESIFPYLSLMQHCDLILYIAYCSIRYTRVVKGMLWWAAAVDGIRVNCWACTIHDIFTKRLSICHIVKIFSLHVPHKVNTVIGIRFDWIVQTYIPKIVQILSESTMVCTQLQTMRMAFTVLLRLVIDMYAFEVNKPVCRHIYIQPPQPGHRCITDTQICINKTDVRDQQHCTWLCMRDPNCGVVNYNNTGVYCLLGHGPCVSLEKDDDFVTTALQEKSPCLKWLASYKYGTYSPITYTMSIDISDSLNIVRGRIGNNRIPGKGWVETGKNYYSWEGQELLFTDENQYEFLALSPECTISWVHHDSTSGNPLPTGAVIGGNLDNVPLYITRKFAIHVKGYPAVYSAGYYNNLEGLAHIPHFGLDMVYISAEILVVHV